MPVKTVMAPSADAGLEGPINATPSKSVPPEPSTSVTEPEISQNQGREDDEGKPQRRLSVLDKRRAENKAKRQVSGRGYSFDSYSVLAGGVPPGEPLRSRNYLPPEPLPGHAGGLAKVASRKDSDASSLFRRGLEAAMPEDESLAELRVMQPELYENIMKFRGSGAVASVQTARRGASDKMEQDGDRRASGARDPRIFEWTDDDSDFEEKLEKDLVKSVAKSVRAQSRHGDAPPQYERSLSLQLLKSKMGTGRPKTAGPTCSDRVTRAGNEKKENYSGQEAKVERNAHGSRVSKNPGRQVSGVIDPSRECASCGHRLPRSQPTYRDKSPEGHSVARQLCRYCRPKPVKNDAEGPRLLEGITHEGAKLFGIIDSGKKSNASTSQSRGRPKTAGAPHKVKPPLVPSRVGDLMLEGQPLRVDHRGGGEEHNAVELGEAIEAVDPPVDGKAEATDESCLKKREQCEKELNGLVSQDGLVKPPLLNERLDTDVTDKLSVRSDGKAYSDTTDPATGFRAATTPAEVQASRHLGWATQLLRHGNASHALEELTKCIITGGYQWQEPYLLRAGIYRSQGKLKEAINDLERATIIDPYHFDAHQQLGLCLREAGRPADALAQFSACQRIAVQRKASNNGPASLPVIVHVEMGHAAAETGNHERAISCYTAAILRDRSNGQVILSRAKSKEILGDERGAIEDYHMAFEEDPDLHKSFVGRALKAEADGKEDEALAIYRELLFILKKSEQIHQLSHPRARDEDATMKGVSQATSDVYEGESGLPGSGGPPDVPARDNMAQISVSSKQEGDLSGQKPPQDSDDPDRLPRLTT